jgi:hypothetical protein
MSTSKTPERVNDDARPEHSDLVEVVRHNADFRKWGTLIGAFLYLRSLNAARPRSFWWKGIIAAGTMVGGLVLRYGVPTFG